MNNGLEQLREMLRRDRNHPSICTWGLCNEVNGQNPVAKEFIKRMYAEAKRLDPTRPCTYAAHSLFKTPANDAAALLDFVSFNQYYGSWQKGGAEDLRATMQQLCREIPGKPIVISEYGYCACTAERPEGDEKRVEVLRTQDPVLRDFPAVAGLIFFCYNDYRTHVGDKGAGALQQRVHGVVDLYGAQKPSYLLLRDESSPIAAVTLAGGQVQVETRSTVPAHTITGYRLRALVYGRGDIPLEKFEFALPPLKPGEKASVPFTPPPGAKVVIDILRPTGFSAFTIREKR
jgi:beta-glucuronidase